MKDAANEYDKCYYKSADEIESLVQRLETCALPPSDMNHAAHLAISAWYLSELTMPEGADRIRESLIRFIKHNGLNSYNETITLFWVKLVSRFLQNAGTSRSIKDIANDLIARFGDSQIMFDYYSRQYLLSKEAQAAWVEPDLKSLDF
jgi:hypothetical protein